MRKSSLRLYGPLLAIALVQAVFITVAPSTRPDQGALQLGTTGFDPNGSTASGFDPSTGFTTDPVTGETFDPATGETFDATGAPIEGGGFDGSGGGGSDPGTSGGGGGQSTNPGQSGGGGGGSAPQAAAAGDTSHCKGQFQFDILLVNPPCKAKFTGNNGGATYQGVTADKIKIVLFQGAPSAAVDAILASQGLAATEEESDALIAAAKDFIEKNYELYGRKLELIEFESSGCPTSPPNLATCKESAREVIKMKPFMVVWGTSLYAEVFDEWSRAGIVSIGGQHFEASYFNDRRPYRYDVFMDGTQSAQHMAEYYCKKMAAKPAANAGNVIHPTIGGRSTIRKLGISVPEIPANVRNAELLKKLVKECGGGDSVISTYESDIERAQEQTSATVQRYIDNKVTTIVCMCDPIAPVFLTKGLTQANYFPENLLAGIGLLDYDVLGRLYDTAQWQHAFGPSHLQEPIAFEQQDQSRMWKASGRSGLPCSSCGLAWAYYSLMAQTIHNSGPNLNPLTVEQGMLSLPPNFTGKVGTVGLKFGPKDYTAISDVKEVRWSSNTPSKIDNKPGAYIALNSAKRYQLGQWPNGLQVPPAAS